MKNNKIKIFAVCHYQDDPKKNTALKLKKFNLVKVVKKLRFVPRKSIILDPFADKVINLEDRKEIKLYGLTVIDCSWNKINSVFKTKYKTGRRLPRLIAANSINYGRWEKLSSVEALAAALYLTGYKNEAEELLSKFTWGPTFYNLNINIFEDS
ncbi:MAG: DUF367 family protein [archaeon]|nr:DUF367 family protein [archaeon]